MQVVIKSPCHCKEDEKGLHCATMMEGNMVWLTIAPFLAKERVFLL